MEICKDLPPQDAIDGIPGQDSVRKIDLIRPVKAATLTVTSVDD